jgi:succinyl-CoA synthetase beta subunit
MHIPLLLEYSASPIMKLHEYQAKEKFANAGIPTPTSTLADSVEGVLDAADEIGFPVAIKAQVQVGGRGKAGGIKVVDSADAAEDAAESSIGMELKG